MKDFIFSVFVLFSCSKLFSSFELFFISIVWKKLLEIRIVFFESLIDCNWNCFWSFKRFWILFNISFCFLIILFLICLFFIFSLFSIFIFIEDLCLIGGVSLKLLFLIFLLLNLLLFLFILLFILNISKKFFNGFNLLNK